MKTHSNIMNVTNYIYAIYPAISLTHRVAAMMKIYNKRNQQIYISFIVLLCFFIIKAYQLHTVSRMCQGRQRELNVKTLCFPLSTEIWRHCVLLVGALTSKRRQ